MKLDCVLTSCNNDPMYIDFIPIFIKAWKKLYPKVDVKIILIHDTIPEEYIEYEKNIILFKPIPDVSNAFTSQYIRLLYPALLNYKNGVMITDMDILPMNASYYIENIKQFTNEHFVYLRHVLMEGRSHSWEAFGTIPRQIAMCYNVALPNIWSEIFNIQAIGDINNRIKQVYESIHYVDGQRHNNSWSRDQIDLYTYVMKWNKQTKNFKHLSDKYTGYNRLDRNTFILSQNLKQMIQFGVFSDYHCYRPYKQFKDINDTIVSWL